MRLIHLQWYGLFIKGGWLYWPMRNANIYDSSYRNMASRKLVAPYQHGKFIQWRLLFWIIRLQLMPLIHLGQQAVSIANLNIFYTTCNIGALHKFYSLHHNGSIYF